MKRNSKLKSVRLKGRGPFYQVIRKIVFMTVPSNSSPTFFPIKKDKKREECSVTRKMRTILNMSLQSEKINTRQIISYRFRNLICMINFLKKREKPPFLRNQTSLWTNHPSIILKFLFPLVTKLSLLLTSCTLLLKMMKVWWLVQSMWGRVKLDFQRITREMVFPKIWLLVLIIIRKTKAINPRATLQASKSITNLMIWQTKFRKRRWRN